MNNRAWSPEEELELIRLYNEEKQDVTEIAEYFEKKPRSIISKLVQLKIYRKPSDDKEDKRSVKSMVIELEKILGIEIEGLNLTKKSNLERVVDGIKNKLDQTSKQKQN
jgi:transposase-like protein